MFPGLKGATFRSLSSLAKPFAKVAQAIGVKFRFTQRGVRRTFNDLSRAAKLEPDIIRSISGHHTDQIREWYSTYRAGKRRAGIAAVIDVVAAHRAIGDALGGSDFDDSAEYRLGLRPGANPRTNRYYRQYSARLRYSFGPRGPPLSARKLRVISWAH